MMRCGFKVLLKRSLKRLESTSLAVFTGQRIWPSPHRKMSEVYMNSASEQRSIRTLSAQL